MAHRPRVVAVIVLLIVAAVALHGYLPGVETPPRDRPTSSLGSLFTVVAMVVVSMGKPDGKHETKNGTYYVLEKFPDIIMDSATYGVPNTSPEGYKLHVQDAVRIDNSGAFVHSAPWSVGDQGKRNVSHGCINLSPANAQWFYDNFGSGDPVVIKNSVGLYNQPDGASDWQMF